MYFYNFSVYKIKSLNSPIQDLNSCKAKYYNIYSIKIIIIKHILTNLCLKIPKKKNKFKKNKNKKTKRKEKQKKGIFFNLIQRNTYIFKRGVTIYLLTYIQKKICLYK